MTTSLITGANKGLGLETARQLIAAGHQVWIGARDKDRGNPGYTATDLNQHRGEQSVEEGAETIVHYALIGPDGPTGGFFDRNGSEPW